MSEENEDKQNKSADEKIDGLVRSMKSICETIGSFDQRLKNLECGDGTHGSSSSSSLRFGPFDHELYSHTGTNRGDVNDSQSMCPTSERGASQ